MKERNELFLGVHLTLAKNPFEMGTRRFSRDVKATRSLKQGASTQHTRHQVALPPGEVVEVAKNLKRHVPRPDPTDELEQEGISPELTILKWPKKQQPIPGGTWPGQPDSTQFWNSIPT